MAETKKNPILEITPALVAFIEMFEGQRAENDKLLQDLKYKIGFDDGYNKALKDYAILIEAGEKFFKMQNLLNWNPYEKALSR